MKTYTPQTMQKAEQSYFEKAGVSPLELMQKAAANVFFAVRSRLRPYDTVAVLCGKGNNAGDGYEIARLMRKDGRNVICVSVLGGEPTVEPAQTCCKAYVAEGGKIITDPRIALKKIAFSTVIVDAVFGIGFRGEISKESVLYQYIDKANLSGAFRVAVDVPSGVRSIDGSVGGIAFAADLTVTISAYKIGMLSYPARFYCGKTEVADIGIPEALLDSFAAENSGFVPEDEYVRNVLPVRPPMSNKGTFGKVCCICGSETMTGAAVLSVGAALRTGAGLVTLASCKEVIDCVRAAYPEPIYAPIDWKDKEKVASLADSLAKYTTVLIGCGWNKSTVKAEFLKTVLKTASAQLVLDADGINQLCPFIELLREAKQVPILTPHPGEFARLTGYDVNYINDNRIACAVEFAEKYRCIVVLKGAGTIIASPDGRYAVNTTGNPGLAKGGSGDVLAGLIAGLAANPCVSAFDAAVCGVYLHGKAADILKKTVSEYGLLPSELALEVAKLLP